MKHKSHLLPHYCNQVAWCWLAFFIVYSIVHAALWYFLMVHGKSPQDIPPYQWTLIPFLQTKTAYAGFSIITAMMAIIAVFSQERIEDEMINSYRLKSVAIVGGVAFILDSLVGIDACSLQLLPENPFRDIRTLLSQMDFLVLAYLFLFKIMVWVSQRRARNEE